MGNKSTHIVVDYPGARALIERLQEIEQLIQDVVDILEPPMCAENELHLEAETITALRSIIDKPAQLERDYVALWKLWKAR